MDATHGVLQGTDPADQPMTVFLGHADVGERHVDTYVLRELERLDS